MSRLSIYLSPDVYLKSPKEVYRGRWTRVTWDKNDDVRSNLNIHLTWTKGLGIGFWFKINRLHINITVRGRQERLPAMPPPSGSR